MRLRCLTCGGTFDSELPDHTQYFHACGPVREVAITRSGQRLFVLLADIRPTDLVNVRRGALVLSVLVTAVLADDIRLGDRETERPDKRDENVIPGAQADGPRRIKAEGRGVTAVP